MKKTLILLAVTLGLGTAFDASAQQLKIGTVDMKKVFENYYKTKDAEQRINEERNVAKKELEDRMDSYKKLTDEVKKLNEELSKTELSKETKDSKSKQRDEKITDLKAMEREIQEFQTTRQKQLEEQSIRMRGGIVDEIQKVVKDRVKSEQFDIVLDKSGPSLNGVPVILYSRDSYEFTDEVITALNKNRSKEDTASSTAASEATPKPTGTAKKKP